MRKSPGAELVEIRWRKPHNVERRVNALADHVAKIVDKFPPLTEEQRDKLRAAFAPALDREARASDPPSGNADHRAARVVER